MARGGSDVATEYDEGDESDLYDWLDEEWDIFDGTQGDPQPHPVVGTPSTATVEARIEWAGMEVRSNGGVRTTRLEGLELGATGTGLTAARKAVAEEKSAGKGFVARGWHAQLKALTGSRRGTAATESAGLTVTRDTLVKWLASPGQKGDTAPSVPNQRKIDAAYLHMRDQVVSEARTKAALARHELAEQVSAALEERFGQPIRLRDFRQLDLG